jgi:membrane-associated phospholipid phosphatase
MKFQLNALSGWIGVLVAVSLVAPVLARGATPQQVDDALPEAPLPQAGALVPLAGDQRVTLRATPANILKDQGAIWTSPARVRINDLKWLVPLVLVSAAAMTTDRQAVTSTISHDRTFNHDNDIASNVLTAGLIVAPVALFGRSQLHTDEHAREAGILGAESMIDGVVVEQGLKLIFWRERPSADGGRGRFFQTSAGTDSSFPSSHSVISWASAAELAGEYPGKWVGFTAYTAAAGVSITRVLSLEHFPSDVVVGSAAGWLIGRYVYRKRHRVKLYNYE